MKESSLPSLQQEQVLRFSDDPLDTSASENAFGAPPIERGYSGETS